MFGLRVGGLRERGARVVPGFSSKGRC